MVLYYITTQEKKTLYNLAYYLIYDSKEKQDKTKGIFIMHFLYVHFPKFHKDSRKMRNLTYPDANPQCNNKKTKYAITNIDIPRREQKQLFNIAKEILNNPDQYINIHSTFILRLLYKIKSRFRIISRKQTEPFKVTIEINEHIKEIYK